LALPKNNSTALDALAINFGEALILCGGGLGADAVTRK
jgi:hypothetical protein